MMLYIAYQNPNAKPQIEYAFSVIFSIYGIKYQLLDYGDFHSFTPELTDLVISYGEKKLLHLSQSYIHIYESNFFRQGFLEPESMPVLPLQLFIDLPIIYRGHGNLDGLVRKCENLVETNIDIIASSFFMLSRYEETVQDIKDEHDCFPPMASLGHKEGFLHRPIVNEYAELLWSWIHSLQPELSRKTLWPEGKEFAICLTHDIDSLTKYPSAPKILRVGITQLRRQKPRWYLEMARNYLAMLFHLRKGPYETLDDIVKLEGQYGFRSSFYFKAGDSSIHDENLVGRPKAVSIIRRMEDKGWEVGLHAGYNTYKDVRIMSQERDEVDRAVSKRNYGCRQHCLRWKTPDTWRIQEKLGLLYDTSLGFNDELGFRCGICVPFKPFDIKENRELDIWELPLTVMDASFDSPRYQGLSPEGGYGEIIKHINMVKKYGGCFVLLWHNTSFQPSGEWTRRKETYQKLMKFISTQNVFVTSGREIIQWWKSSVS